LIVAIALALLRVLQAIAIALWRILLFPRRVPSLPHQKRSSLLSAGELRFYRVLLNAIPPSLIVCPKVRLMDVVSVPDNLWQEYGARGSGVHLDFVLADASTLEPKLVIELDDRSHRRESSRQRDAFKDAALEAAGMPVLRVSVGRYDVGVLRERIRAVIER
jgi:hypothetical protein